MEVAIFEDDAWRNFRPLSSDRHVARQLVGPYTTAEHLARRTKGEVSLFGRDYLARLERERTGLRYNDRLDGSVLLINARLNPTGEVGRWSTLASGKAVLDRGEVAVASTQAHLLEGLAGPDGSFSRVALRALSKDSECLESESPLLFSHPWEVLEASGLAILEAAGGDEGGAHVSPSAEVEDFVSFDTRDGPVIVEEGARLEAFTRLSGPCYIGKGTVIHSALIRGGTTISDGCKVGGEVAQSTIYRRSNKAHLGYLGHSIVGEWVNVGAGAVTSDLKNTYGTVKVNIAGKRVDTGLVKVGAVLGDMARISIGTMIYGGKTVGVAARCEGLVDDDVPEFTNHARDGTRSNLGLEQVLVAQERMKARRGEALTDEERSVLGHLYESVRGRR